MEWDQGMTKGTDVTTDRVGLGWSHGSIQEFKWNLSFEENAP